MKAFGKALLWFFLALITVWFLIAAGGLAYMEIAGVVDRNGGISMGLIFMAGPLGGVLAGLAAAAVSLARSARTKPGE